MRTRLLSALFALTVSLATLVAAADVSRLPRSTAEEQGVSSEALRKFLDVVETKIHALHSIMIVRRGHVIAEGWWAPFAAEEPHQLFSLSKSFTSTAVGLAVADGRLSVDDLVLKFFPDEAPEKPSANLRAMRVRDLLTMSTGHHDEDIRAFPYNSEESVVKKFLALPVAHKPGTFFLYNTPASYMLSAIVQKVTGQAVLDYLQPRLFGPLGIEGHTWEASRQGVSMGGFGLSVRTEDIACFGQLYLQKGKWRGQQLVPAAWVEAATARQTSNGSAPTSDWEQGYGYQFWRCRHGFYRGDGAHGQFCLVLPQYDTVIAITAGTRDLRAVPDLIWEQVVPLLEAQPRKPDAAAASRLRERLAGLTLRRPKAIATPPLAAAIAGQRFVFPKNPQAIEAIALTPAGEGSQVTNLVVTMAGADQRVAVSGSHWQKEDLSVGPIAGQVALSGAWTAADTFSLELVRYRTPFAASYQLKFAGDQVTLATTPNVGPATAFPPMVGRRE